METPYRILMVEDDNGVALVMSAFLQTIPAQVEIVANGKTALDRVRKEKFDAVYLDLMLPEMSGLDFLKHLNGDPHFKRFPILVNSTMTDNRVIAEIKSYAKLRVEYIPRPGDPQVIVDTMKKLLGIADEPAPAEKPERKKKVIVVDDDETIRELYVPYFTRKGYDVTSAADGAQALKVLAREKVDLMILDLAMPGLQGEDVMEKMAEHPQWKKIPIIVESAMGQETGRPQKLKERFQGKLSFDFYQRPNSLEKLEQAMSEIIAL